MDDLSIKLFRKHMWGVKRYNELLLEKEPKMCLETPQCKLVWQSVKINDAVSSQGKGADNLFKLLADKPSVAKKEL
jgi:hypothetical protein